MSKVVIIGGSGHVGTYLVPRLVEAGFEVVNVSRGQREAYAPNAAWKEVRGVTLDREAEEKAGTFGRKVRELKPDIVIDMICFTPGSAKHLAEALKGQVSHFLHCGTSPSRPPRWRRAGPSASTASRRPRSRAISSTRPGGMAFL